MNYFNENKKAWEEASNTNFPDGEKKTTKG